MKTLPLSHHDILVLAEPFTRRGRHVCLAASDRLQRHLAFKPVDHAVGGDDEGAGPSALRETLLLEPFGADAYRLTRTLTVVAPSLAAGPGALQATLRTVGTSPAALLAGIEAVPPLQQFRFAPAYTIAISQRLAAGAGGPLAHAVVTQAVVRLAAGLQLTMEVSSVSGVAGEIRLSGPAGSKPHQQDQQLQQLPQLPQDLLAVQGWNWARLARDATGWRSRVKLRGKEPQRSRQATARLEEVAEHLARTLAAPPAAFHARHLRARWGVVLRRGIPVLTLLLLALGVFGLSRFAVGQQTGAWVLLIHVPTLMLAISFKLQEMAQFEIPPLPRRLTAPAWWA